jgi:HAD superfamily hydrolase (TIGR01450 family)
MARRLLDAGYELIVWNRSPERTAALADRGARVAATPAEAAARSDVVITMLADPNALAAVAEGENGIAAGVGPSLTVIDMSTVGPAAVERLAAALPDGVDLLDAPVLGSLDEAQAGALTIFVGGPAECVERWSPLLATLGSLVAVGPLGSGQAAKLVANGTLFGMLGTLGESLALGRGLGLGAETIYRVLATTPLAAQAERRRPSVDAGRYPRRFSLSLARKDAELIRDAAAEAGIGLRVAPATLAWLTQAEAAGLGDHDYTAILATILRQRVEDGTPTADRRPHDGLIVDLDGVVWLGGDAIDGAAEAIADLRETGTRIVYLTNDPQSSRDDHAARLRSIGVSATAADVLTSAAATARFLAGREHLAGCELLAIGSRALREEFVRAGFRLVDLEDARRALAVVVGGHVDFDYGELRAATDAVLAGAELYATGRDAVLPTRDGPWPATGAILAAVETATGVAATVVGKPEPFVFEIAREALAGCRHVAVVGDDLESDIGGAKRAGLDAILVLTGNTTQRDLDDAPFQPDAVLLDLAAVSAWERA